VIAAPAGSPGTAGDDVVDSSSSARRDAALRWAAGAAVALASYWVLLVSGVAVDDTTRYAAYWLVGVMVPGVIVHRLLRGQRPSMVEDLGLGAATGIALELLAGLLLGAIGADALSRWWWLLVYVGWLAVPRMRRAVRTREWQRPESVLQAWSIAAVSLVVVVRLLPFFREAPLPPQDSAVNIDPWWHLSLVAEMLKPGSPQVPQVVGEPLVYHWFSHLHMAIAGATSGVDLPTVVFRLWIIPVALATVAVVVALARQVSGVAWSGPLAAWLTLLAIEGGALWSSGVVPARVVFFYSPSQTLTNVLVVAAAACFVDATRRRLGGREWVWLVLLVFACMGVKPTALTALLGGTLLATAGGLLRRRLDSVMIATSVVLALLLAFVMPMMSGSLSGKMTLFASLESLAPYAELAGSADLLATSSGVLLDSLDGAAALLVASLTIARLLVGHATTFVGMLALTRPAMRRDGASWWLMGALLSGWAAFFVVDHPSRSQFYFLSTVFVFGAVLTAWLAASLTPSGPAGRRLVLAALASGVVLGWIARHAATWLSGDEAVGLLDAIWIPMAVAGTGVALGAGVAARRWARSGAPAPVLATAVFMVLGLAIPGAAERVTAATRPLLPGSIPVVDTTEIDFLSAGAQEAALWLADNTDPTDVLATNAHCRAGQKYRDGCDARGFWLGALSQRRVLLEGWGYTAEASAQWGVGGQPTARQPSPWPERLRLSQQVFADPTEEVVNSLAELGVTWLVGVRSAGPVDDSLAELAVKEFDNGDVSIYRIPATTPRG
jgi:hypothetical protein